LTRERQDAASRKTAKFCIEEQCLEPRPERGVGHGTSSTPLAGLLERALVRRSLYWGTAMDQFKNHPPPDSAIPPLPVDTEHWLAIVRILGLSPRQADIAEFMLRGAHLKEIVADLGIEECTIRTQWERALLRTRCQNKMQFALRVWAISREIDGAQTCPQNR